MKLAAALLLAPLCAALAQIPTPESVLGHKPGDDFYLASYDDSLGYFQKLAHATDKLKLVHVGKTTQGRDWYIGAMNTEQARAVPLPLGLLGDGKFKAKIYEDGATPTALNESTRDVSSADTLTLKLAPSGGAAVRISR